MNSKPPRALPRRCSVDCASSPRAISTRRPRCVHPTCAPRTARPPFRRPGSSADRSSSIAALLEHLEYASNAAQALTCSLDARVDGRAGGLDPEAANAARIACCRGRGELAVLRDACSPRSTFFHHGLRVACTVGIASLLRAPHLGVPALGHRDHLGRAAALLGRHRRQGRATRARTVLGSVAAVGHHAPFALTAGFGCRHVPALGRRRCHASPQLSPIYFLSDPGVRAAGRAVSGQLVGRGRARLGRGHRRRYRVRGRGPDLPVTRTYAAAGALGAHAGCSRRLRGRGLRRRDEPPHRTPQKRASWPRAALQGSR